VKKTLVVALITSLVLGIAGTSFGASRGIAIGTRYHMPAKDIAGTDFDESHLSFSGGFRYKANGLILDVDVDYRPTAGDVTYSITPKVSLLFDLMILPIYAGAGAQKTYVKWSSGDGEWGDLTYVLQAGAEIIDLGSLTLLLDAYYDSSVLSLRDIDAGFITLGLRLIWYL
jgi:hypothetical protein